MTTTTVSSTHAASSIAPSTPWLAPRAEQTASPFAGERLAEPAETLAQRLDWLLGALPVACQLPDADLERAILRIDPTGRLVLRSIRLAEGTEIDLIAVPSAVTDEPARLSALRALRRRRHRAGLPLRLIREAVVAREPRLSQARLIADCAQFRPSARAGERLMHGLRAQGGSAPLRDCLAALRGELDPACAVLALVGSKHLTVPLDELLGPDTTVSLSPLTHAA